jgi:hypothetical protein
VKVPLGIKEERIYLCLNNIKFCLEVILSMKKYFATHRVRLRSTKILLKRDLKMVVFEYEVWI